MPLKLIFIKLCLLFAICEGQGQRVDFNSRIDKLFQKYRYDDALSLLDSVIAVKGSAALYVTKAYCLTYLHEDPDTAYALLPEFQAQVNDLLENAISEDPNYGPAYYAKYKLTLKGWTEENYDEHIELISMAINHTADGELKASYIFEKANEVLFKLKIDPLEYDDAESNKINSKLSSRVYALFNEVRKGIAMTANKSYKSNWHRRMAEFYAYPVRDTYPKKLGGMGAKPPGSFDRLTIRFDDVSRFNCLSVSRNNKRARNG